MSSACEPKSFMLALKVCTAFAAASPACGHDLPVMSPVTCTESSVLRYPTAVVSSRSRKYEPRVVIAWPSALTLPDMIFVLPWPPAVDDYSDSAGRVSVPPRGPCRCVAHYYRNRTGQVAITELVTRPQRTAETTSASR